jgi:arylsulfatase A-like enzyme
MKQLLISVSAFIVLGISACQFPTAAIDEIKTPNIVVIYADDLGFGDVGVYGSTVLKTPNIDQMATEGLVFMNGYATSATCTPSRYSLITGEYPWRNQRAQVLSGEAPLLIDTNEVTLPLMLKKAGYTTGVVGKWHLGIGDGQVDWNKIIRPGPNEIGFDYSYIMAATNDRVPTVYVENGNVLNLEESDPLLVNYKTNFEGEPTGKSNPEQLKVMYSHGHNQSINNGISRIGYQKGGKSAQWIDENMADTFLVRAQQFVREHKHEPFFLFYALHQPHVPRIPHPRFAGTTGLGPRGDVIAEADWCVGEFMTTLKELGIAKNTLVIFSSDNGPILDDGYVDESAELLDDHTPWGPLRGTKYSLYDAGTHVPFIVSWSAVVEPGVSKALVSQIDLYASLAALTSQEIVRPDSENVLEALLGKSQLGRKSLVVEGLRHRTAYREDNWVLIPPYSGGKKPGWGVEAETGFSNEVQLYNLADDPGQTSNIAAQHPDKVDTLMERYKAVLADHSDE